MGSEEGKFNRQTGYNRVFKKSGGNSRLLVAEMKAGLLLYV